MTAVSLVWAPPDTLTVSPLALLPHPSGSAEDPLRPLVLEVRAGNVDAFRRLYEETRHFAHAVLYRLVGQTPELEDLLQESYLQLLHALREFRGEARTTTFLYRVCANVALMHLRKGRRRPEESVAELPERAAPAEASPERAAELKQAAALLEAALGRMSAEKRVVFVYHELLGLRPEEISLALEVPVNTVRSRLGRAREELSVHVAALTQPRREGGRDESP